MDFWNPFENQRVPKGPVTRDEIPEIESRSPSFYLPPLLPYYCPMETPDAEPKTYTQEEWDAKTAEIFARHGTGPIKVRRSSGEVEENWVLSGKNVANGRLIVSAVRYAGDPDKSTQVQAAQKEVTIAEFEELNG